MNVFYTLSASGYYSTVVWAGLCVVVSAYYYMNIVRTMYFPTQSESAIETNYMLVLLAAGVVLLGVLPQGFLGAIDKIVLGGII